MQHTTVLQTAGPISALKTIQSHLNQSLDSKPTSPHQSWQVKISEKGTITAYKSGKIVIQAVDKEWAEEIAGQLNSSTTAQPTQPFIPHIGVDEAGKGDYFGSMVIAGAFIPDDVAHQKLLELGVKDSKKISDKKAITLREEIIKILTPKRVTEIIISPSKYDELHAKTKNVNKMLASGHARAIEDLLEDVPPGVHPYAIIDQFARSEKRILDALLTNGSKIEVKQMHKAESDIAVAAASIVARGRFLLEMVNMREKYGINFPKGASNVIPTGREFVEKYGEDRLGEVAKLSFRTTGEVLGV